MAKTTLSTLRQRVTIEKASYTVNNRGVEFWNYPHTNDFKVFADIETYSAHIVNGEAEKISELEYRITIRFRRDIGLHDRVNYNGRIFEQILPAKDIDERHKWLQLTCREKVT